LAGTVAQLNPVWNESFEFELGPTPTHRQLAFHVYDWDRLSSGTRHRLTCPHVLASDTKCDLSTDDPLGNISLPLDGLYRGVEKQEWHTLYNVDHGQINVCLHNANVA
jgi:Ca2+-dependent lipid-binding protein